MERREKNNLFQKLTHSIKSIFFSNKNEKKELSPLEALDLEISKQESNLKLHYDYPAVEIIVKKIADLKLQKIGLTSNSSYIKQACKLLKDKSEEHLMQTLYFLDTVPMNKIDDIEKKDILACSAYIAEILQEYKRASDYYKKAINSCNDIKIVQEFKKYLERLNILKSVDKEEVKDKKLKNLEETYTNMSEEVMLKSAEVLENMALNYAKSPKGRELAKRYYKEVLYILRKLIEINQDKYFCKYIKVLIDGVEFFMFSNVYLQEAIDLLKKDKCKVERETLIERVKALKDKKFIQKSKILNDIIEL